MILLSSLCRQMQINTRDLRKVAASVIKEELKMGNAQKNSLAQAKEAFMSDVLRNTQGAIEFKMEKSKPTLDDEDVTEVKPPTTDFQRNLASQKHFNPDTRSHSNGPTNKILSSKLEVRTDKVNDQNENIESQLPSKSVLQKCLNSISKSLAIEESGAEELAKKSSYSAKIITKPARLGSAIDTRFDTPTIPTQSKFAAFAGGTETSKPLAAHNQRSGYLNKYPNSKIVTDIETEERDFAKTNARLARDRLFASGDGGEEFSLPSRISSGFHKRETLMSHLKKAHPFESEEEAEERRALESRRSQSKPKSTVQLKSELTKLSLLKNLDQRDKSPSSFQKEGRLQSRPVAIAMKTASKQTGTIRVEDCDLEDSPRRATHVTELDFAKQRSVSLKRTLAGRIQGSEKLIQQMESLLESRRSPSYTNKLAMELASLDISRMGQQTARPGFLGPPTQSLTAVSSSKYSKFFPGSKAELPPPVSPLDLSQRGRLANRPQLESAAAALATYALEPPVRGGKIGDSRGPNSKRSSPVSHGTIVEEPAAAGGLGDSSPLPASGKPAKSKPGPKKNKDKELGSATSGQSKSKGGSGQHPDRIYVFMCADGEHESVLRGQYTSEKDCKNPRMDRPQTTDPKPQTPNHRPQTTDPKPHFLNSIEHAKCSEEHFLVDGFPRNPDNYQLYQSRASRLPPLFAVLEIQCSESTMLRRMHQRVAESDSPPRSDDNESVLRQRFRVFDTDTRWVLDRFRDAGLLRTVSSELPLQLYTQELAGIAAQILAFTPK